MRASVTDDHRHMWERFIGLTALIGAVWLAWGVSAAQEQDEPRSPDGSAAPASAPPAAATSSTTADEPAPPKPLLESSHRAPPPR